MNLRFQWLFVVAALAGAGVAVSAFADTGPLLFCTTGESKELRVLADGDDLVYQYGDDVDRPELEIRRRRDEVPTRDILLPGPIWQRRLTFSDGKHDYEVIIEAFRPQGEPPKDRAGVRVQLDKEELADKSCTSNNMVQRVLVVDGLPSYP